MLREKIDGKEVTLAGMAKGAGMIHPDMATLLVFIFTDAAASPKVLKTLLRRALPVSFNRITIDGDTSTNDTILLLAGGRAGNPVIEAEGPAHGGPGGDAQSGDGRSGLPGGGRRRRGETYVPGGGPGRGHRRRGPEGGLSPWPCRPW